MSGAIGLVFASVGRIIQVPDPDPDPSGIPGESAVTTILNVVSWIGLVGSVLAVIVGGGTMAFANASANSMLGSRGKMMVLWGLGGALVVGLGPQLVQWVFDLA